MKTAADLQIETPMLLMNGSKVIFEYGFEGDNNFESVEIPLSLFNLWLIHNHNELRQQYTFEGEVSWIDMFYYDIPDNIQREFILHWDKIKIQSEQEAA
jgi:hypothetical protein